MNTSDLMTGKIATAISQRRKALQMTQEELALLCGLSTRSITKIESGEGNTTLTTLIRIATALGLNFSFAGIELTRPRGRAEPIETITQSSEMAKGAQ